MQEVPQLQPEKRGEPAAKRLLKTWALEGARLGWQKHKGLELNDFEKLLNAGKLLGEKELDEQMKRWPHRSEHCTHPFAVLEATAAPATSSAAASSSRSEL